MENTKEQRENEGAENTNPKMQNTGEKAETKKAGSEPAPENKAVERISKSAESIRKEIGLVLVGQEKTVDLMLAALLTGGHVLLEGVPGIAKTLMARLLANTVNSGFSRIQFTPDLMPSDVVGTNVYNMKTSDFNFKAGPIFSNIILIDEINRAPAKTQAALFEVMEERQVTVDGETRKMEFPFFVIATQNPIEQEGTYKLPEAQLDRFTFRLQPVYPTLEEEIAILERFKSGRSEVNEDTVKPVISPDELLALQKAVYDIHIEKSLIKYIAELIKETRETGSLFLGASPRASLAVMHTSKAVAALRGRDFVIPDDIRYVLSPVLNHRLILSPDKEISGTEIHEVMEEIINKIEVPR